jgi:hypothetical protein
MAKQYKRPQQVGAMKKKGLSDAASKRIAGKKKQSKKK